MSEACFMAMEPLLGTKAACAAVGRPRAHSLLSVRAI